MQKFAPVAELSLELIPFLVGLPKSLLKLYKFISYSMNNIRYV